MEPHILIVGDVIIDEHIQGTCTRISPEAPVPVVATEPSKITLEPGAALYVALNIANANIPCLLAYKSMSRPKNDFTYSYINDICIDNNIVKIPLNMPDVSHGLSKKTRIWIDKQQVCRVDLENTTKPDSDLEFEWFKTLKDTIDKYNVKCVLMSDYNKGTLTDGLIQNIANHCHVKGVKTILDPKRPSYVKIKRLTMVKPNAKEIQDTNFDLEAISDYMGETIVFNTQGKNGLVVYQHGEQVFRYHSMCEESSVLDVCGCGDIMSAMIAICNILPGAQLEEAAVVASAAVSYAIQHRGCYVLTKQELSDCLKYAGLGLVNDA